MSKKSRKRNKRILGVLGALGAAALLGRNKGTAAADVDSGRGGDSSSAKARVKANTITGTEYPGANKVAAPIKKDNTITRISGIKLSDDGKSRIGAAGVDSSGLSRGQRAQIIAAKANAPKGIIRPGSVPMQDYYSGNINQFDYRAKGGRAGHNSGGKVKGVGKAKRGFGRALKGGK